MSRISKLSKLSNISRIGTSTSSALRRAFWFDWTNDYISSNATIGRTGYDMNVSGNVSTGSDADGSYIQFNGNRDWTALTWTVANVWTSTTPVFNQWTSVTVKVRFKFTAFPSANISWLFASIYDWWFHLNPTALWYGFRWSTAVVNYTAVSINTLYDAYIVYNSSDLKFYGYLWTSGWASTLLNVWWTTAPTTFSTDSWDLWDNWILLGNAHSCNKYIYHAAIRNKALTQAEIDADIALWNTAKNDPSIVAYYIPENLTYNTQYASSPKDLSNASWVKWSSTTVTADTTVAPDGTTTADTVVFPGTSEAVSKIEQNITTLTWSQLASKTFIVKVFVKVGSGTAPFRLKLWHWWVATYYSSTLTATTVWQEFTFTQTLTSSTSWTNITPWIVTDGSFSAATLQVRNVRLFLVNETLRDESPNIWWFIWWKTPLVMSAWVKPNIDSSNNGTKQVLFNMPRHYMQLRDTNNWFQFRSETTLLARTPATQNLWNGFRWKAHLLWVKYRDWTWRLYKAYVNWTLVSWSQTAYSTTIRPASTIYRTNASVWFYTTDYRSGNIRDIRAYTFTWSFTDADALAIYNGGEPTSSWITKYLHYRPPVGEVGTTTQDQSPNDRDWTLNGWVTRPFI